ncbi:MAG: glycosyltransferase family 2 protein, partial [Wenzhouxiangella sp.]
MSAVPVIDDGHPALAAEATVQPAVPVVILNWNGLEDTQQCVDHLLASQGVSFRVILVDNGSDGDDCDRLKARYGDHPLVDLRCNNENLGFARGMNRILAELLAAGADANPYVVLLNNDAFPEPEWLAALVEAAERTNAGAVASCMMRHDNPALLDNAGHAFLNTGEVLPRGTAESPLEHARENEVEGVCGGACL